MARVLRWAAAPAAGVVLALTLAAPAQAETVRQGQWFLDALHVPQAHQISTGKGVIIGMIDSGVDASHPDLAGQILPGASFGADIPNAWSTSADADHGTGVAGILVAKGGGDTHALGIAPGAKVLPTVVPEHDPHFLDDFSAALHWLVDHGANVINASLGADTDAPPVDIDAIRYALSKDVVVVAGAGNVAVGHKHVITPARIPGVIAVSGVSRDASFWSGSVSGPEVVLSAPAVDMVTTSTPAASRSGYGKGIGTSFAAPIVAGAAALIRARYPDLDAANVVNRLIATAKDQGTVGRDPQYGFGTVRILNALTTEVPRVNAYPISTPPAGSPSGPAATARAGRGSGFPVRLVIAVGAGLLVIVVIVVIVVAVSGRGGRRPPPPPPGYPPQPPYRAPPGQHPAGRAPPGTGPR